MQTTYLVKSFLLLQQPKKGVFALFVIILAMVLVYLASESLIFLVLSFLILTLPSVNFLFPVQYEFKETYYLKTQLLYSKKNFYKKLKGFQKRQNGLLPIKTNGKGDEFIYIFDEELKCIIYKFLEGLGYAAS